MGRVRLQKSTGGSYQPLPEGTYDFKILDVEQGVSRNQNPQLRVGMEVLDGAQQGKTISVWYSLLPQSLWNLYNLTEALAIEMDETGDVDDKGEPIYDFDDEILIGCCVQFSVGLREYNGKKNNTFNDAALSTLDPQYSKLVQGTAQATAAPEPEPEQKPEPEPAQAAPKAAVPSARRRRVSA